MEQVSVFEAKNRLSALLDQVEQGRPVTITRRGRPIARLVPAQLADDAGQAAARLRALRSAIAARGQKVTDEELRAWRDEGRR
ncbi:type II toxin-antitoxin system Phd/YefM family antitoxin [Geminicoccus flavidas]|uniref:type II toxin-antitoxin system Phd/YefM family antitoxin n=1 Tax=Geminicoccus flavidas TaxID=2506407 RepID=UPI001356F080|nr:type II toxin-antitoxin system prevent-host-death family antitoxin [Geminicoccus flavidas]